MTSNQRETCTQSSRAITLGVVPNGIGAMPVIIEVELRPEPGPMLVQGLSGVASTETCVRCRSAITASGYRFPASKLVVKVSAAEQPSCPSGLDLPIALALLAATEQLPERAVAALDSAVLMGELSFDGRLRPVRSVIPAGLLVRAMPDRFLLVPNDANEVLAVPGLRCAGADTLRDAVDALGEEPPAPNPHPRSPEVGQCAEPDLSEVRGCVRAKRALEIAAAGGHHLLMLAPPGSGKTMLARRLPGLLPPLSLAEALETSAIQSAAGRWHEPHPIEERPFRAPHHSISMLGLLGGGPMRLPGEVSLATNGILFLDDLVEFAYPNLQPLADALRRGSTLGRTADGRDGMPARCLLVATANPCACGFAGTGRCRCSPVVLQRYAQRLRLCPLFELFDLQVDHWSSAADETSPAQDEAHWSSARVRERVSRAVELRMQRKASASRRGLAWSECPPGDALTDEAVDRVTALVDGNRAPAAISRVLRVARTIADLAGEPLVTGPHMDEALTFRALDAPAPAP